MYNIIFTIHSVSESRPTRGRESMRGWLTINWYAIFHPINCHNNYGRNDTVPPRYDTSRDTWVTIRYVSRYLGHDTIRLAILGSRYDTSRDTWVTIRYVSRYLGHDTIRLAILGSRYDTYRDTWVTIRYVSRYLGHDTICIAILAENGKMD